MNKIVLFVLLPLTPLLLWADMVAVEPFDSVPTNTPITVRILWLPTEAAGTSSLSAQLSCMSGTGGAVFYPSATMLVDITNTSYLNIIGTFPSDTASNMVLKVSSGSQIVASSLFTVVTTPVIGSSNAIAIAANATSRNLPIDAPIGITLSGSRYTVTFFTVMQESLRQGDYHAQIVLDATSGTVFSVFAGP